MHDDDSLGYQGSDNSPSKHWHLDKRVPIALILTLLLQTGAGAWWMASTTEKIFVLEKRLDAISPQADRLTRVEVNIEDIKTSLTEIKQALRTAPLREH
jgi:hypothetical protein